MRVSGEERGSRRLRGDTCLDPRAVIVAGALGSSSARGTWPVGGGLAWWAFSSDRRVIITLSRKTELPAVDQVGDQSSLRMA